MSSLNVIGEVTATPNGGKCFVEWKMKFHSLAKDLATWHCSPDFSYESETWRLVIYPNGSECWKPSGYMDLRLRRRSSNTPSLKITFSFALKTVNGKKGCERQRTEVFEGAGYHDINRIISKPDFEKRQSEFLSCGYLTVICTLKTMTSAGSAGDSKSVKCSYCKTNVGAKNISTHEKKCKSKAIQCPDCSEVVLLLQSHECQQNKTKECSYCKKYVDAENILLHEKKCMDRPVKCPDCSEVVSLQNWYDHQCQTSEAEGVESLCQVFKKVLLDGCDHDLILKTDDREFRAHKDVLRARSPVFKSMLSHDMVEKNSGVIDVPDCDSQAMEQFLFYVYSGKVESIDQSNMTGLYYISDKYEMKDLKEACATFIKKSLSITNFCAVIQLALNHSDSNLLHFATEYFMNNMLDILRRVEWQSFMKDNSTVANELIIKSCERKK